METKILKGKPVADAHIDALLPKIDALKKDNCVPKLRVILVGEDPASKIYTQKKAEKCLSIGIDGKIIALDAKISTEELLSQVVSLNNDPSVHGILIQLPLPEHIDSAKVLETVDPNKDVDGFHAVNVGRLQLQDPRALVPCTAKGVIELLKFYEIPVAGKHIVILGRSNIVGRPLSQLLSNKSPEGNATVTLCHSRTPQISEFTTQADIIIAAIGAPLFLTGSMIKYGSVLIDVGTSPTPPNSAYVGRKRIVGDIDIDNVLGKAAAITPVPGGIGPMTISMLMHNTVHAAEVLHSSKDVS